MLESNLVVLRNRFPVVLDRILASGKQPPLHFKYIGEELHTLRNGKSFPTYGAMKHDKLFKHWLSAIPLKSESLYSVTGFGNGAHVRQSIKQNSPKTNNK